MLSDTEVYYVLQQLWAFETTEPTVQAKFFVLTKEARYYDVSFYSERTRYGLQPKKVVAELLRTVDPVSRVVGVAWYVLR